MFYTGIGTRSATEKELVSAYTIGLVLGTSGHILRSGKAIGMDISFQRGVGQCNGKAEIYVPWRSYNTSKYGDKYDVVLNLDQAMKMAEKYHPAWYRCSDAVKKLHARNMHQVLGRDLKQPSSVVVFAAPEDNNGNVKGGTGIAVRCAIDHGIKTLNLRYVHLEEVLMVLSSMTSSKK